MRQFIVRTVPTRWVPYVLHLRPKGVPIVAAQATVGFLLANGFQLDPQTWALWGLMVLAWAVLGNGGTLAFNSAFDRDEGDVAFLHDPPRPPRRLAFFALVVMALGALLSGLISTRFLVAYLVCWVMSVLYSMPPFRMKGRPGVDMLISSLGYGAMTAYAGWAAVDRPLVPPITNVSVAFFFLLAAWYPVTQFYQMEEDRRRGDRTLSLTIGKRNGLILTTIAAALGFAFLGAEVALRHWALRSLGVGVGFLCWAGVIVHWWFNWRTADRLYERTGMYRLVWAFAVTQIGVVVAMAPVA